MHTGCSSAVVCSQTRLVIDHLIDLCLVGPWGGGKSGRDNYSDNSSQSIIFALPALLFSILEDLYVLKLGKVEIV